MSEAKQRCQLDGCNRAASTRCFCCSKNVCTRHFTEHIEAVKAQIDPLVNDINEMVEKIQDLTIEKITETSFAQLQQWRVDMHQLIDEIFLTKTKEMEDLIEKNKNKFVEHKKQQSETVIKIQDDVRQLAEDGDATFEQIQLLKNQLSAIETNLASFQNDFLSVNVRVFGQGLVTVSSSLKKPSPQVFEAKPTATAVFTSPGMSTPSQTGVTFAPPRTTYTSPTIVTSAPQSTRFSFSQSSNGLHNNPSSQIFNTNTTTAAVFTSPGMSAPVWAGARFSSPATTYTNPTIVTSTQQPATFLFGASTSGLQNNPPTHSTSAASSFFGSTPTSTAPAFGTTSSFPGFGSVNNQSPYGGTSPFQFGNNGQK